MSGGTQASRGQWAGSGRPADAAMDPVLALTVAGLAAMGLIVVATASVGVAESATGDPLYYFNRQLLFMGTGLLVMAVLYRVPLAFWAGAGPVLLMIVLALLVLVLVPGVGKSVKGATRWLPLGVFNLQVSELAKPLVVVYVAGYLVRRGSEVRESMAGFLKPMAVMGVLVLLLLLEPDFGTSVVLLTTVTAMLFLGGVRLGHFAMLLTGVGTAMAIAAISSPYRLKRITGFLDPWQDPFASGFQLTQSLIAIGSGGWFGAGLGASIQKLHYLPEVHTDFVFAVLAEELGLIGATLIIALFALLVWRCFVVAGRALNEGLVFGAYVAYGIGVWLGFQAAVNIGVTMGVLPTKGLTLPLLSSGGSSVLAVCLGLGLVFAVQREVAVRRSAESSGGVREMDRL